MGPCMGVTQVLSNKTGWVGVGGGGYLQCVRRSVYNFPMIDHKGDVLLIVLSSVGSARLFAG